MFHVRPPDPSAEQVEAWIVQARAGSSEALNELMQFSRAYLLLIANDELPAELQAKGGASDLVQESQFEATGAFADFRGHSPAALLAWLRGILLHNVQDFTRRYTHVAKRRVARELSLAEPASDADAAQQLAADQSSPSTALQRTEQADRIEMALTRLPEDYRQVIVWRHREGLSFDEISRRLGRSVGAVRKLWSRAIQKLQDQLPIDDAVE